MLNYLLSTESACDLSAEQIKNLNLNIAYINLTIGETEYSSADGISTKTICDNLQNGVNIKTSQINEYAAEEYFTNLLKQGKDILHISFSSAMSGTFNNFKSVAEKLNKTNKNKIIVVDSLCQSYGVGLLITWLYNEAIKNNFTIEQSAQFLNENKLNIAHIFIVDTLTYLAKGGRINPAMAKIGNILKIKPVLKMDNSGKIVEKQKAIGRKKSISILIDLFKQNYNKQFNHVFINHSETPEEATEIANKFKEIYPEIIVTINDIGPIVACHCGPNVIATYYTIDNR